MYSLRPRPEHLFLRFIEEEAKVGTSFRHPMQPNHRITYGRIPQFDYILRICSLINAKHLNVYIYIRIRSKRRNLERCRAKWQFALEGFLSMDAHYCVVPSAILNTRSIPIPLLFFAPRVNSFLSLSIFPLLLHLFEYSRGGSLNSKALLSPPFCIRFAD